MLLALFAFVSISLILEFFKGAGAIRSKSGTNILTAMVELTHRNTRRYGGYLVHMGIVLMFIGFTRKTLDKDVTVEAAPSETMSFGPYQLALGRAATAQNENYC